MSVGSKRLLIVLLVLCTRNYVRPEKYTVTGFFGCRFSDVCTDEEICVNDELFGSCQDPSRPQGLDKHEYNLTPDYLQLVIGQLENLVAQDYTWSHLYTQCVVGNLLLSYRVNEEPDLTFCDPKIEPVSDPENSIDPEKSIDPETLKLLQELVDEYKEPELEKRENEFVKVHKYLKERKSSLPEEEIKDYLRGLTMEELLELKDYLLQMRQILESDVEQEPPRWNKGENEEYPSWLPVPESSELAPVEQQTVDKKETDFKDDQFLTPDEAKMIFDLIDGKELPDDLSEEEIERLTEAVSNILQKVRNQQENSLEVLEPALTAEEMTPSEENEKQENEKESSESNKDSVPEEEEAGKRSENVKVNSNLNAGPGYSVLANNEEAGAEELATVAPTAVLEPNVVTDSKSIYVDSRYVFVEANRNFKSEEEALRLLGNLQYKLRLRPGSFSDAKIHDDTIVFRVNGNEQGLNASQVAKLAGRDQIGGNLMNDLQIVNSGTRKWADIRAVSSSPASKYLVLALVVCGCVAGSVLAILAIYLVRRHNQSRQKLDQIGDPDTLEASKDYQDLCRQRMQSKASEKPEPLHAQGRVSSVASEPANSPSSRSSTSSWSEEPVTTNMDITTGHIILSYMEDHMKNKDRLDEEWEELSNYTPDLNQTEVASNPQNARKNRYSDILPYDHSRVVLNSVSNVLGSDYINASTITDHDPRNPAYIATQGPLPHTVADFWQMVWEQGSVVIVMLTKMTENGNTMCHRYWPEEGSDLYHIYEVHLVSEHIWCDDYLVRSFYLKNLQTNETRTVTQFHFLTWPDLSVPSSAKALLDFRRKVNKSYKGRSCPIVVHCSDGVGRTGIYCLIDMVLSRLSKGAKEIDIAATLEHIRDQRMSMVKTKEQFEFVLTAVAEEVHAILKALPSQ